ncbi:prolyl-tRNA synthetase associated domain-containing protein [Enterococcus olivae]
MTEQKQFVLNTLEHLNISYQLIEHPAIYTALETVPVAFPKNSVVVKNLFLRNAKGSHYYLFICDAAKTVDLKLLQQQIGSTRLSFGSEERLQEYLGLTRGSVSPLGLLNDLTQAVTFYADAELVNLPLIGVHPNDNTATVFLSFDALVSVIESSGHRVNI